MTNLFFNPKFTEGHYPVEGISGNVPKGWGFSWASDLSPTFFDLPEGQGKQFQSWHPPESSPINATGLPESERHQFIFDWQPDDPPTEQFTWHIFKGSAPAWVTLWQSVALDPGKYIFGAWVAADPVQDMKDGRKIYPDEIGNPDWPLACELRLMAYNEQHGIIGQGEWIQVPEYGFMRRYSIVIDVPEGYAVTFQLSWRGRWGLQHNGIFIGQLDLRHFVPADPAPEPAPEPDPEPEDCVEVRAELEKRTRANSTLRSQLEDVIAERDEGDLELSACQMELEELRTRLEDLDMTDPFIWKEYGDQPFMWKAFLAHVVLGLGRVLTNEHQNLTENERDWLDLVMSTLGLLADERISEDD